MDASVLEMWTAYLTASNLEVDRPVPSFWHFCDNPIDADVCAQLVLSGKKRATAPSLWYLKSRGLPLPIPGDLDIVTNWQGVAQCIIRTTAVSIVRFCDVSADHAMAEGEGDGSLEHWKDVHWRYYGRELLRTEYTPTDDMPLVCQYFERVYP
jgi:uncharacterized protein YhfF